MTQFDIEARAGLLKAIFRTLSTIVDECRIDFRKEGILIQAVDPAHVAMVEIEVSKKAFSLYRCKEEGEYGLDIDIIKEILKKQQDDYILRLKYNDDGPMEIRHGMFHRKVASIDTNGMSRAKIPSLMLPAEFKIKYSKLREIMRQLADITDHYTIKFHEDGVEIEALSEDSEALSEDSNNDCSAKIHIDLLVDHIYTIIEHESEYTSKFPEDYLTTFIGHRGSGISGFFMGKEPELENIKISMGNDYPAKIHAENKNIKITYFLAPRIDNPDY